MIVTGTIDVEEDGSVSGHVLDQPEKLPRGVVALVDRNASQWKFEPVLRDGKAVKARAKMSLHVVARALDDTNFTVEIDGANFGDTAEGEGVASETMKPPGYPLNALRSGVTGIVYLVVQVDRSGAVADVVAEQVNLTVLTQPNQMPGWRDALAEASIRAARHWRFRVPSSGPESGKESWSVRVPVQYLLGRDKPPGYGHWQTYVPGPVQVVPWVDDADSTGRTALAAGSISEIGKGLRLLTPLDQG